MHIFVKLNEQTVDRIDKKNIINEEFNSQDMLKKKEINRGIIK